MPTEVQDMINFRLALFLETGEESGEGNMEVDIGQYQ